MELVRQNLAMANRDIVAIGTSAGGVEALLFLVRHLPVDLPASILVTIHLSSQHRSALDEILSRAGPLKATFAAEGDVLRKGQIYIAPPSRHLLVEGERLALGRGPRENNARPAVDPMMRSTALCCGSRTIGVILTGALGDGASGLWAVSQAGGMTVVQDPRDAAFPGMPRSALERLAPDHVTHLADMPRLLQDLVRQPAGEPTPVPDRIKLEVDIARTGHSGMREMDGIGRRSTLTCPDCNGVMWEIDEGEIVRYRCHQGHAYTGEVMAVALDESLRHALGSGLRALEERIALLKKLRNEARGYSSSLVADNWRDKANDLEREAQLIRDSMRRIDEIAERREDSLAEASG
jgi:two-component system, chemotaxis family, protein-glutamate methylesterase/glutaminase